MLRMMKPENTLLQILHFVIFFLKQHVLVKPMCDLGSE